MTIGKLTRVPLREVWIHEARDFTTWLQDNLDTLNDALNFTLVSAEREQAAGDFSVDLVGETEDGETVVIENQLERSDHDHLGKLLTYTAAMDAKAAVWIVSGPRSEHVAAMVWLNETASIPFYLVQVEAVRIGESEPAPLFTRIVGPSQEARAAGQAKKRVDERSQMRLRFWEELLAVARGRTDLHANISPSKASWVSASGGRGLSWNYVVRRRDMRVELYIDRGDPSENLAVFESLEEQRRPIEAAFGRPMVWQRLEKKRACRIACMVNVGGWEDEARWPEVVEAAVEAMIGFEAALRGPIRERVRG